MGSAAVTRLFFCLFFLGTIPANGSNSSHPPQKNVKRKNRPGLDRGDRLSHGRVLLDVYGPVHDLVPHGRLVGPVHHVDLHLDCSRERRRAHVLRDRLQLVRLSLEVDGGGGGGGGGVGRRERDAGIYVRRGWKSGWEWGGSHVAGGEPANRWVGWRGSS